MVQAGAQSPLRLVGGRAPLPDRTAPGRVRGLCPAPVAGHRGRCGQALRHRRDHSRAGVHACYRVLRWRRGDRRRRRRRPAGRPGASADPHAMGRGDRTPRPQAGQPDGPRRAAVADRRRVRPGATITMATGGRPGQHDAGAGGAHRPRARLPPGVALFHGDRPGRGIRGHTGGGQPFAVKGLYETPSSRPIGRVPCPRPPATTGAAATLERSPGGPGRGHAAGRHRRSYLCRQHPFPAAPRHAGARLWHRPGDGPGGTGGSFGGLSRVHCLAAVGLDCGARHRRQREGQFLAGLRSSRGPGGDRNPDRQL